jgi:hypothetical protein
MKYESVTDKNVSIHGFPNKVIELDGVAWRRETMESNVRRVLVIEDDPRNGRAACRLLADEWL